METLFITRQQNWKQQEKQILGLASYKNFACNTLELPWRDNQVRVSCIPAGEYIAVKFNSHHNGSCILLKDVPNRTYIELHSGNFNSDILGCILAGNGLKDINHDNLLDVIHSRVTLNKLLALLPDTFKVIIK